MVIIFPLIGLPAPPEPAAASSEFPQSNAYYQAKPSVVWCADASSTTTLEVHIVGRDDVKHVWLTGVVEATPGNPEGRARLFDDGTHGDEVAGDNIFTLAGVVLPCNPAAIDPQKGYRGWLGFLRVELDDSTELGNNYGLWVAMVDPMYKGAFPAKDLGDGLSATSHAFFIVDTEHEIMSDYPVSDVRCGKTNFVAYQKLYSVYPDMFDFATVMPGMQIFREIDLAENVPYAIPVSNSVQNIGMSLFDNTALFGSASRLRAVIYHSFGGIDIMDHELGHAWAAYVGGSLGLLHDSAHWSAMADVQGQMGAYYIGPGGEIGHFAYNGDGTWRLIPNTEVEPYSPLELYVMGMIPPEEVPDIHILEGPDLTDPDVITVDSFIKVTIEQIMAEEGGARVPSAAESQKDFTMAFIVTQDTPYNDAAYAFFSLSSRMLMSKEPPLMYSNHAPFYWATGGRGTLDTSLYTSKIFLPVISR